MDVRLAAARSTLLLGTLLTILGVGTYALTAWQTPPAPRLVPALFGIAFIAIGILALRRPLWSRSLVYTALGLALLAIALTVDSVALAANILIGHSVEYPAHAVQGAVAFALCSWFVGVSAWRLFHVGEVRESA